eukprot:4953502-Prymnesium_polylepis.3
MRGWSASIALPARRRAMSRISSRPTEAAAAARRLSLPAGLSEAAGPLRNLRCSYGVMSPCTSHWRRYFRQSTGR